MATVRLLLALLVTFTVTTVTGFSEGLKYVGRVPFRERFIRVLEDVHDKGRYYATPLAILDLNSTSCVNNILTGKFQLFFEVILWSTEAKNEVYHYIRTHVNSSVRFERVDKLNMAKVRLRWTSTINQLSENYRFDQDWHSAEDIPNAFTFFIKCESLENCSRLETAMKSETNLLTGLELEYTRSGKSEVGRSPLTGKHLLSTNLGRRLMQLRPWPASTQYRYLRPEDVTNLVDQTMNTWLSTLPKRSSYSNGRDNAQLEAQLTALLRKMKVSSVLFPRSAWESVLWTPASSRPDKLACYLNRVLAADRNPQYFQLDTGRRSASEEGAQTFSSRQFFGVTITNDNTTARSGDVEISNGDRLSKIDKRAFLERLRLQLPHVGFNGRRFAFKSVQLYRLDLNDLQNRNLLSRLDHVKFTDAAIHGIPIRSVQWSNLTTEFRNQAEVMNLTKSLERLEVRLQNTHQNFNQNFEKQSRRLNKTEETLKNATGVVFTRWGRTVCPEGSDGIYTGYVVASDRAKTGGMGMFMCLTDTPTYYTDGRPSHGYTAIYRTEYYSYGFLTTNAGTSLGNHDMVCTACRRSGRSTSVILWGSKECRPGWYKEYEGIIVSAYDGNELSSNAICVDGAPEIAPGGQSSSGKSHAYTIDTHCTDTMPCPPFQANKELTCAVCSK